MTNLSTIEACQHLEAKLDAVLFREGDKKDHKLLKRVAGGAAVGAAVGGAVVGGKKVAKVVGDNVDSAKALKKNPEYAERVRAQHGNNQSRSNAVTKTYGKASDMKDKWKHSKARKGLRNAKAGAKKQLRKRGLRSVAKMFDDGAVARDNMNYLAAKIDDRMNHVG